MDKLKKRRMTSPGYRVSRLARLNFALIDHWAEYLGISHGQVGYMCELLHREGRTQDEIAEAVGVNRSATARALALLERKKLVRRRENPENRRQKLVYPTEKARMLEKSFFDVLDRNNAVLFGGFTEEEKAAGLALFDRMIANVESALAGEAEE